jgi:hypothetical protein
MRDGRDHDFGSAVLAIGHRDDQAGAALAALLLAGLVLVASEIVEMDDEAGLRPRQWHGRKESAHSSSSKLFR